MALGDEIARSTGPVPLTDELANQLTVSSATRDLFPPPGSNNNRARGSAVEPVEPVEPAQPTEAVDVATPERTMQTNTGTELVERAAEGLQRAEPAQPQGGPPLQSLAQDIRQVTGEVPDDDALTPEGAPAPSEGEGLGGALKSFFKAMQEPGMVKLLANLGIAIGGPDNPTALGEFAIGQAEGEAQRRFLNALQEGGLDAADTNISGLSTQGRQTVLGQFQQRRVQEQEQELAQGQQDLQRRRLDQADDRIALEEERLGLQELKLDLSRDKFDFTQDLKEFEQGITKERLELERYAERTDRITADSLARLRNIQSQQLEEGGDGSGGSSGSGGRSSDLTLAGSRVARTAKTFVERSEQVDRRAKLIDSELDRAKKKLENNQSGFTASPKKVPELQQKVNMLQKQRDNLIEKRNRIRKNADQLFQKSVNVMSGFGGAGTSKDDPIVIQSEEDITNAPAGAWIELNGVVKRKK